MHASSMRALPLLVVLLAACVEAEAPSRCATGACEGELCLELAGGLALEAVVATAPYGSAGLWVGAKGGALYHLEGGALVRVPIRLDGEILGLTAATAEGVTALTSADPAGGPRRIVQLRGTTLVELAAGEALSAVHGTDPARLFVADGPRLQLRTGANSRLLLDTGAAGILALRPAGPDAVVVLPRQPGAPLYVATPGGATLLLLPEALRERRLLDAVGWSRAHLALLFEAAGARSLVTLRDGTFVEGSAEPSWPAALAPVRGELLWLRSASFAELRGASGAVRTIEVQLERAALGEEGAAFGFAYGLRAERGLLQDFSSAPPAAYALDAAALRAVVLGPTGLLAGGAEGLFVRGEGGLWRRFGDVRAVRQLAAAPDGAVFGATDEGDLFAVDLLGAIRRLPRPRRAVQRLLPVSSTRLWAQSTELVACSDCDEQALVLSLWDGGQWHDFPPGGREEAAAWSLAADELLARGVGAALASRASEALLGEHLFAHATDGLWALDALRAVCWDGRSPTESRELAFSRAAGRSWSSLVVARGDWLQRLHDGRFVPLAPLPPLGADDLAVDECGNVAVVAPDGLWVGAFGVASPLERSPCVGR